MTDRPRFIDLRDGRNLETSDDMAFDRDVKGCVCMAVTLAAIITVLIVVALVWWLI